MNRDEAKAIHEKFSTVVKKFCADNGIIHTGSNCSYGTSGEFAIRTRMVYIPSTSRRTKAFEHIDQQRVDLGMAPMGLSVWAYYSGDEEAKPGYYAAIIVGTKPRQGKYIFKWVTDDDEDRQYLTGYSNLKLEHPKTSKRTGL